MRASAKLNIKSNAPIDRLARQESDRFLLDKASKFLTAIQAINERLLLWLSGNNEPRIWQTGDADDLRWHVYDPFTRTSSTFTSEKEIRIWLEQRYSR